MAADERIERKFFAGCRDAAGREIVVEGARGWVEGGVVCSEYSENEIES